MYVYATSFRTYKLWQTCLCTTTGFYTEVRVEVLQQGLVATLIQVPVSHDQDFRF